MKHKKTHLKYVCFLLLSFCCLQTSLFAQTIGGVYIDSQGMLRETKHIVDDSILMQLQKNFANQTAPQDIARPSRLRKISLSRLEALIKKATQEGDVLPPEVKYLAGMIRVESVFFYPDKNDVVIAGPAEGWKQLRSGEVVGVQSNRPVLHLDDLLVALRYAFAKQQSAPFIGCSIEPTKEGLKRYAASMKKLRGQIDSSRLPQILKQLQQSMGPQDVKLYGIPKSSHFALTMLVADYRMKRISLAHDPSPSQKVVSYLDLATSRLQPGARSPFQYRFWFLAKYNAIYHTKERTAFQFSGQGVQLMTARQGEGAPNQPAKTKKTKGKKAKGKKAKGKKAKGKKKRRKKVSKSARQFTRAFTKNFPEMAARVPVFAEMQNCIALTVVAQLMREEATTHQRWKPSFLLDKKKYAIEKFEVPRNVPSLLNDRKHYRQYMIGVSGGVKIKPEDLIAKTLQKQTKNRRLINRWKKSQQTIKKQTNWWWD